MLPKTNLLLLDINQAQQKPAYYQKAMGGYWHKTLPQRSTYPLPITAPWMAMRYAMRISKPVKPWQFNNAAMRVTHQKRYNRIKPFGFLQAVLCQQGPTVW